MIYYCTIKDRIVVVGVLTVARFCEHGRERYTSIKGWKYLD